MPPDEVIICDDCSKDSTVNMIQKYIDKYQLKHWNVYENEKNKGYSKNFSDALKLAKGDIIFLADQTETMVSMKMTQKDMPQSRKLQSHATKLYLSPFSAINHKQIVANIQNLRTRIVTCGGQSRPTPQNIYLKLSHFKAPLTFTKICISSL